MKKWIGKYWFVIACLLFSVFHFFYSNRKYGWVLGIIWILLAALNFYRARKVQGVEDKNG